MEAVGALLEDAPCLTAGKPDSEVLTGVFGAAALHGLAVEQLEQCDLEKNLPGYAVVLAAKASWSKRLVSCMPTGTGRDWQAAW